MLIPGYRENTVFVSWFNRDGWGEVGSSKSEIVCCITYMAYTAHSRGGLVPFVLIKKEPKDQVSRRLLCRTGWFDKLTMTARNGQNHGYAFRLAFALFLARMRRNADALTTAPPIIVLPVLPKLPADGLRSIQLYLRFVPRRVSW